MLGLKQQLNSLDGSCESFSDYASHSSGKEIKEVEVMLGLLLLRHPNNK
jgi:hypothetical protein